MATLVDAQKTTNLIGRRDVAIGTVMAVVMGTVFIVLGGRPLAVTFIPGLVLSWCAYFLMFRKHMPLNGERLMPLYLMTVAWQFIHFAEEFLTNFNERFPLLYGSSPFSRELFVSFNMVSYFVFVVAFLLTFKRNLKFFLIPVLFFVVYGAIGNAISHTWWVIWSKDYFPGFFTALPYWILGPYLLSILLGSVKRSLVVVVIFAALLIPLLTLFAK